MTIRGSKTMAAALTALVLVGTVTEAYADRNRYSHRYLAQGGGYRRHGIGAGGVVAGAALGILGAAAVGAAANSYNGYPAYGYGGGYGPRYGYDYIPDHGYYGPY